LCACSKWSWAQTATAGSWQYVRSNSKKEEASMTFSILQADGKNPPQRKKALVLALLLGFVGGHHYYLGHHKRAIFYLVFCWTGIPLAVAVTEALNLYCMDDTAFNKKYA